MFEPSGLLVLLLVGLVAGWLAGKIVRGAGFGIIADMAIGIVGAFFGSWLLARPHGDELGAGIPSARPRYHNLVFRRGAPIPEARTMACLLQAEASEPS